MKALVFLRRHLVGILTLIITLLVVRFVVVRYRTPGSMTVLEAQGMAADAGAPASASPVALETVSQRKFAPTVTYTGSVVAYNDEMVYPRVTGRLVALMVYPGDRVRAGQVVARLDNVELSSRENEAASARRAAEEEHGMALQERRQAVAQKSAAEARIRGVRNAIQEARSQLAQARAIREQAERELSAAEASRATTAADIAAAEADVEYWDRQLMREQQLEKAGAASGEELQRATAQTKTARARLTQVRAAVREKQAMVSAAEARIRQAEAGIQGAEAGLAQTTSDYQGAVADATAADANVDINAYRVNQRRAQIEQTTAQARTAGIVRGYAEIRTDQDGVVTERLVSPGTLVQPGMPILRVQKVSPARLQANVAESDLSGIRVGSPVTVTTLRDPSFRLTTRVSSVFEAANPQSRTVIVEALAANTDRRLVPGQYVVMQIATAFPRRATTVPVQAVRRDESQKPYVWTAVKAPSGTAIARRIPVKLGPSDGRRAVIVSGLRTGDRIIVRGLENLNDGAKVFPTSWGTEGPTELPPPSGDMPAMRGMPAPGPRSPSGTGAEGSGHAGHGESPLPAPMEPMPGM